MQSMILGTLGRAECGGRTYRSVTTYWTTLLLPSPRGWWGRHSWSQVRARSTFRAQLLDWRTLFRLFLCGGAAILNMVALRRIPMSRALPHHLVCCRGADRALRVALQRRR